MVNGISVVHDEGDEFILLTVDGTTVNIADDTVAELILELIQVYPYPVQVSLPDKGRTLVDITDVRDEIEYINIVTAGD